MEHFRHRIFALLLVLKGEILHLRHMPAVTRSQVSLKLRSLRTQEVKRYERERRKNKSTYWITHELLWRDFVRFGSIYAGDGKRVGV
jgi:hypothetical protein